MRLVQLCARHARQGWQELVRPPSQQVAALDGLRALAVLLVIADHFAVTMWPASGGADTFLLRLPVVHFGWTGVDLFFVLSGFLIGGQVWKERIQSGSIDFRRFFLRRAFRIWPLYFAVLILLASGLGTVRPEAADWLLISNYFSTDFARSWSLSSEEMFYLALPAMLLLTPRLPIRLYAVLLAALIPMIDLARFVTRAILRAEGLVGPVLENRMYSAFHLHSQALIVGLIISLVVVRRPEWFRTVGKEHARWMVIAASMVMVVAGLALRTVDRQVFAYTALGLIYGGAMLWAMCDRSVLSAPLRARIFYPLSRLSYGMYLNHLLFFSGAAYFFMQLARGGGLPEWGVFLLGIIVATLISIVMAVATFIAIERPFLELRRRLIQRRPSAQAERPAPELRLAA